MTIALDLSGKIALVSGASRGIGEAILHGLAKAGATVVGTATSDNGVSHIEAQLKTAGYNGGAVICDIADAASVSQAVKQIQDHFGQPHILVNNAGITDDNLLLRLSEESWDKVISTNLTGVFRLSKALLRGMLKHKWGRIITIGSVVGSTGNPGQASYCAAKAALVGFTKSLAAEVANRQITANVIAPGFIQTDMTDKLDETQTQALKAKIPLGLLGSPEDIAHAAVFLASDAARYITGETLHVNGGMYMA